jgi:adenylosuccinate lyase
MSAHPIDFDLQANVFATPELKALFDERARIERWLNFEAALARAQAELEIIPQDAAEAISAKSSLDALDLEAIRTEYTTSRNSVMPVLKALRQACGKVHGEFVHYGATTQDVIDTGEVLEIKATLDIVKRDLGAIEEHLICLARTHRDTPMIGRTHSQQALPITLGAKFAVWLAEIDRHSARITSLTDRVLVGQLGGAVGTMAALGEQAEAVKRRTMEQLDLLVSPESWHTARDNVAETCTGLAMIATTLAKIANEIILLGRTEIAELREPPAGRKTASSSTMPHKRNPVMCERILVLATHARALSGVVMESMLHENERDPRALWAEWLAVPQIAIYTGTALDSMKAILADLEVFPQRMLANLHLHKEMVASEWLLFRLAPKVGKMHAQELLHRAIQQAEETGDALTDVLCADAELGPLLEEQDLAVATAPEGYLGQASQIVDKVIAAVELGREGRDADATEHSVADS